MTPLIVAEFALGFSAWIGPRAHLASALLSPPFGASAAAPPAGSTHHVNSIPGVAVPTLIHDLAVILVVAAVIAFIFRRLRQPVVLGFILAGMAVGPKNLWPSPIEDFPSLHVWGELGVIFLMFALGLEFSFRRIARLSSRLLLIGLVEVLTMLVGTGVVISWFGWESGTSLFFLAPALAISSTTIIVKSIHDAGHTQMRASENVFGILIVEDVLTVLILVALGGLAAGHALTFGALARQSLALGLELVVVIGGWFVILGLIVPRFMASLGRFATDELVTIASVALCLGLAVLAEKFRYSAALGAFVMGSILTETRESSRIQRLVHPLKDLFAAIFFVSVGLLTDVASLPRIWPLVLLFVLLVTVGKATFVAGAGLITGFDFKTSLRMGLMMGQIGEFSFIIAALGIACGLLDRDLESALVFTSLLTTFMTPYFIRYAVPWSEWAERRLPAGCLRWHERYAARLSAFEGGGLFPAWLRQGRLRLCANAVLVALIFGGTRRFVLPLFFDRADLWIESIAFTAAGVLATPFVYGMLAAAGRGYDRATVLRRYVFTVLTLALVGLMGTQYFSFSAAAFVTAALVILLLAFGAKILGRSYAWLEGSFLTGLVSDDDEGGKTAKALVPWDGRLTRLQVHPNSAVAGVPLRLSGLRTLHGLTIVAIRRGNRVIGSPEPAEILFPADELLVLGTDEQVLRAKAEIEDAAPLSRRDGDPLAGFDLQELRVEHGSGLDGFTIRACRLKERFGALVVGLERNGRRVLNPDPDWRLRGEDRVWVVGPRLDPDAL